jgi:hypothetical protein
MDSISMGCLIRMIGDCAPVLGNSNESGSLTVELVGARTRLPASVPPITAIVTSDVNLTLRST